MKKKLWRYSPSSRPMLDSKVERILSRYRPIAPKPTSSHGPPKPASSSSTDLLCPSSLSEDPYATESKSTSGRKRRNPPAPVPGPVPANQACPKPSKKPCRSQCSSSTNNNTMGGRSTLSDAAQDMLFASSARHFGPIPALLHPDSITRPALPPSKDVAAVTQYPDLRFSEREVAPTRPTESKAGLLGKGFSEMIRGIAGLHSTADVHALFRAGALHTLANAPSQKDMPHSTTEADLCKPVTLSLFPGTPLGPDSPSTSSLSTNSSQVAAEGGDSRLKLYLGEEALTKPSMPSPYDQSYIERVYGSSTDPVLLVDDAGKVVWMNKAYEKCYKIVRERAVSSAFCGPYIDPLGIPMLLGTFQQSSAAAASNICSRSTVTLWGFLKRLVTNEAERNQDMDVPRNDERHIVSQICGKLGIPATPKQVVVSSTVSVERVTEMDLYVSPLSEEDLEAQLYGTSLPAFITDSKKQVLWMNVAYKEMVGQGFHGNTAGAVQLLHGNGVVIPWTAGSFSGCANIQWTNERREKCCMTVPCDVIRIEGQGRRRGLNEESMHIWKLDVSASLRLSCG